MKNDAGPKTTAPLSWVLLRFGVSSPPPFSCRLFLLRLQSTETS